MKNNKKSNLKIKLTSLLLILCLSIPILPANAISAIKENETTNEIQTATEKTDELFEPIIIEEDISKRQENEKHFICDDGSYMAISYSEAVHEKIDGKWVDIKYYVTADDGGISPVDENIKVKFANNTNSAKLVKLNAGGYKISWTVEAETANGYGINKVKLSKEAKAALKTTAQLNKENKEKIQNNSKYNYEQVSSQKRAAKTELEKLVLDKNIKAEETPAVLTTNQMIQNYNSDKIQSAASHAQSIVEYTDAFGDGMSLRYILSPGNINEEVVLNSYNGFKSYSVLINTDGLIPVADDTNRVNLTDGDGNTVMTIAPPYMYDASDAVSKDIEVTVISENKKEWRIIYTPSEEWLTSADRVYPVVIDPTVTTQSYAQSAIYDAYVYAGQKNYSYDSEPYLYVGYYNDIKHISYWGIDTLPTIDSDSVITGVGLFMRLVNGTETCEAIGVYSTDNTLNTSALNWNNKPAIRSHLDQQASVPTGLWVNFCSASMGKLINEAYIDNSQSVDFAIKYVDDELNWDYNMFCSSDHPTVSFRPYLSVKYTTNFYDMPTGKYYIQNVNSGLYLTVMNGDPIDGRKVSQYKNHGLLSQIWEVTKASDDTYHIIPQNATDKQLFYSFSSTDIRTEIRNNPTHIRSQWRFERQSSGGFTISSAYRPWTVLDVNNYSKSEGAEIYTFAYHGNANQRWRLIPATEQSISVNTTVSKTLSGGSGAWYSFNPPTTERFNLLNSSDSGVVVNLYDNQYNLVLSNIGSKYTISLNKDNTYHIWVGNRSTTSSAYFTFKVESAFLDKLQELNTLAKQYTGSDKMAAQYTLQYIRRLRYNGTKWDLTAGSIDYSFALYVEYNAPDLVQYVKEIYNNSNWCAPSGDIIDIQHMAVTFNALFYNSFVAFDGITIPDEYVNHLAGWAGDLRSMIACVLYETNYSENYATVYAEAQRQLGATVIRSKFSLEDMLADIDAVNLYTNINYSNLRDTFEAYYIRGGCNTRYTNFLNGSTCGQFYDSTYSIMTDWWVNKLWPYKKVDSTYEETDEALTVSDTQLRAICTCFADYIWNRHLAE